jgi:hypothetical protein
MGNIEVVLLCPNSQLLTDPWSVVAKDILRARSKRSFISEVIQMATALGEINRYHSKTLPETYFKVLQKRMTELRKIVKRASELERKPLIPWQHLEYLYSGGERKDMKR